VRKEGYYWVEFHDYGDIDAVLFKDGVWVREDPLADADITVLSDTIAFPMAEELAGHAARLTRLAQEIWDEDGADPRWDGVHIDGAYWVKRDGMPPELARSFEGGWTAYNWPNPDGQWYALPGEPLPPVLFGPVDKPRGRHYRSRFLQELLAHENRQERQAEADARKPAHKAKAARVKAGKAKAGNAEVAPPKAQLH